MGSDNYNREEYLKKWDPTVDYRKNPHLYQIGKGQQGVLICEPYKSEILPHWRFKTPDKAIVSAQKIYEMFKQYLQEDNFVGADMAKKYLHMGFTRSRRYANHKSGLKYAEDGSVLPQEADALISKKAQSAAIFKSYWVDAREHPFYLKLKERHKSTHSSIG